jgi:hypothetical protein
MADDAAKKRGAVGVSNTFRRTWDKEEYTRKAQERAEAECVRAAEEEAKLTGGNSAHRRLQGSYVADCLWVFFLFFRFSLCCCVISTVLLSVCFGLFQLVVVLVCDEIPSSNRNFFFALPPSTHVHPHIRVCVCVCVCVCVQMNDISKCNEHHCRREIVPLSSHRQ